MRSINSPFFFCCLLFLLSFSGRLMAADEASVVAGERYDFFCRDGQHFRNAELLAAESRGYRIRIPFSGEEKLILKEDLLLPPRPAPENSPRPLATRRSLISLGAEAGGVHGALAPYLHTSRHLILQYETEFFPGLVAKYPFVPSLLLMGALGQYLGSVRTLSGGSVSGGLAWELPLGRWPALVVNAHVGMAVYDVRAQTFAETSRSVAFGLALGLRYRLGNIIFTLLGRESAQADAAATLYAANLSLGLGYAF